VIYHFDVKGAGRIAGVDNGSPTSHESFKDNKRKVFNGLGLVVIQSIGEKGSTKIKATADGLQEASI
jgi:beta-galactosidase